MRAIPFICLLVLGLGPLALDLPAVINNGIINFDPVPGATRYTLWKVLPGQTRYDYVASFTAPPFLVPGATPDFTTFYLRTISPTNINGTVLASESDFGFVVTPPVTNGTNTLRFIGPVNALILQSGDGLMGMGGMQWTDIATWSNGPPLRMFTISNQVVRTLRTNLPPPMPPR